MRFKKLAIVIPGVFLLIQIPFVQKYFIESSNLLIPKKYRFTIEKPRGILPFYLKADRVIVYKNKNLFAAASNVDIAIKKFMISRVSVQKLDIYSQPKKDKDTYKSKWMENFFIFKYIGKAEVKQINLVDKGKINYCFILDYRNRKNKYTVSLDTLKESPSKLFETLKMNGDLKKGVGTFDCIFGEKKIDGNYAANLSENYLALKINYHHGPNDIIKIQNRFRFIDKQKLGVDKLSIRYKDYEWNASGYFVPLINERWKFAFDSDKYVEKINGHISYSDNFYLYGDVLTSYLGWLKFGVKKSKDFVGSNLFNHFLTVHHNWSITDNKMSGDFKYQHPPSDEIKNLVVDGSLETKANGIYGIIFQGQFKEINLKKINAYESKFKGAIDINKKGSFSIGTKHLRYKDYHLENCSLNTKIGDAIDFDFASSNLNFSGIFDFEKALLNKGNILLNQEKFILNQPAKIYPDVKNLMLKSSSASILIEDWKFSDLPTAKIKGLQINHILGLINKDYSVEGSIDANLNKDKGDIITALNKKKSKYIKINYKIADNNLGINGSLVAKNSNLVTIDGAINDYLGTGKINLNINSDFDILKIYRTFFPEWKAKGYIKGKIKIDGNYEKPNFDGYLRLDNFNLEHEEIGLKLYRGDVRISFKPNNYVLESLKFYDAKDGFISGKGNLDKQININIKDFLALDSENVNAKINGFLLIDKLITAPTISGKITIKEGRVLIEKVAKQNEYYVIKDPRKHTPEEEANIKIAPKVKDLTLAFDPNFYLIGYGIISKWKGGFNIKTNEAGSIEALGKLLASGGKFMFLDKEFNLVDGEIKLMSKKTKELHPTLSFNFERKQEDITINLNIESIDGNVKVNFTSNPTMKQEDILSLVLFNNTTQTLSPYQAIQLSKILTQINKDPTKVKGIERITDLVDFRSVQRFNKTKVSDVVSIGKNLSKKTRASFEKDMGSSDYRASLQAQTSKNSNVYISGVNDDTGKKDQSLGTEIGFSYRKHY